MIKPSPILLKVFLNNQLQEVKQFTGSQIVIGSKEDSSLILKNEQISAIHCVIELREYSYFITDLGSSLGTLLNGRKIIEAEIFSSDELTIGPFKIEFSIGVPSKINKPPSFMEEKNETSVVTEFDNDLTVYDEFADQEKHVTEKVLQVENLRSKKNDSIKINKSDIKPEVIVSSSKTSIKPMNRLADRLRPSTGKQVEVILSWHDRVIETYFFKKVKQFSLAIALEALLNFLCNYKKIH